MFNDVIEARISELWSLYNATGALEHRGEKGKFREAFLRELIAALLPRRFAMGSGVVIDRWNRQSPQADIIIYDAFNMPPILERDGQGIYPIDSVLRVIEVKSIADTAALNQFSKLAWSLDPSNDEGLKVAMSGRLDGGSAYYPLCCFFSFKHVFSSFEDQVGNDEYFMSVPLLFCAESVYFNTYGNYWRDYGGRFGAIKKFVAALLARIQEAANSRPEFEPQIWFDV